MIYSRWSIVEKMSTLPNETIHIVFQYTSIFYFYNPFPCHTNKRNSCNNSWEQDDDVIYIQIISTRQGFFFFFLSQFCDVASQIVIVHKRN